MQGVPRPAPARVMATGHAPAGQTSIDINADAGVLQARRVVDSLIAAETA